MNCKNCGAPLSGYKCEYCGTYYKNFNICQEVPLEIYEKEIIKLQNEITFQEQINYLLNTFGRFVQI